MENNNPELLAKLLEESQKEVRFSRILAYTFIGILIVLVVTAALIVPRALNTLNEIDATISDARVVMDRASSSLDEISVMTESITKTSDVAFESLGKVDFDELNQAISDLRDAVEPMANFARIFQR